MKAAAYILVEVQDNYNNFVTLDNGMEYMVNNSIDDVETINRVGKVIHAPGAIKCEPGDMLLFHHNICRMSWGPKGTLRKSAFEVRPNVFYIPATEVFMIMRKGEEDWEALDPFVFIEPVPAGEKILPNGLGVLEENYKGFKHLKGLVAYPNKQLKEWGVKRGDMVAFQQDSEHEYKLKGKTYYKMRTNDILAVL